jgi:hypothetical protein
MNDENAAKTRKRSGRSLRFVLSLAVMAFAMMLAGEIEAQTKGVHPEAIKQVASPLPKLALNGALSETRGGVQYHRVVLMITNWQRYSTEMFLLPAARKLPPSPCSEVKTRIVISVHSERGAQLSGCIPVPNAADLGKFSFPIPKGKPVPDFVYVVMHDRLTDAAYRSNLVSPSTGLTK